MGIGSPEWTWAGLGGDVASSEEGEIDRGEGIELFAQAARVPLQFPFAYSTVQSSVCVHVCESASVSPTYS